METTGLAKDKSKILSFTQILPNIIKFLPKVPGLLKAMKEVKKLSSDEPLSLGYYLEENAELYANDRAILFEDDVYTHKEFNETVNRYAHYLLSRGVKKGDEIIAYLENRPEILFIIGAVAKIGAIVSLINPHQRGPVLLYSINVTPTNHLIIGEELVEAFEEIRDELKLDDDASLYYLEDRGIEKAADGYIDWNEAVKDSDTSNPSTTASITMEDPFAYLFTSGTTGMPKAAICVHGRWIVPRNLFGKVLFNLTPKDCLYIPLPFYHGTAMYVGWPTATAGGAAVAMRRKFSASNFWKDVEKFNATGFVYIGELCRYLMQQPESPNDSKNTIKKIIGNGLRPDIWMDFKNRFKIDGIYEFYGASEGNIAFTNMLNLNCTVGFCPVPYAIVKYDIDNEGPILDENGYMQKVEKGEAGLLIGEISDETPFVGYTDEEATEKKIFRNVFEQGDAWFDSGDLLRDIGFKHAQFVDRLGDTFRWKGENVSTTQVEAAVDSSDQVIESNVYGVSIPGADGRAGMVSIISNQKLEDFDLAGLLKTMQEKLPAYAVPRFIRFSSDFDKTETLKIKKSDLKKEAYDPNQASDPLYVFLPGTKEFVPLDESLYNEILAGKYSF